MEIEKTYLPVNASVARLIFVEWGSALKARIHCETFSRPGPLQFQGHFMKHEILLLSIKSHCVRFSSIKKTVFTEKRYPVKFNSIK